MTVRIGTLGMPVLCATLLVGCAGTDVTSAPTSTSSSGSTATMTGQPPPGVALPADYHPIPGTRIALRVPAQMQVEPSLPGLARPDSRTSVIVLDQQRPPRDSPAKVLDDMAASFRDESRAARQGLRLDEPQRVDIAGHPALITTGTQTQGGATFDKVLVALPTDDSLVLMTATVEAGDPIGVDAIDGVLRDARWTGERAPSELGVDLTPAPGYREVPSSGTVLVSLNGETGPSATIFQAAPSMGSAAVPPERRRDFAEARFRQLPGNPSPQTIAETTIAGLPGWEVVGNTPDEMLYAAVLFDADGYVALVGSQPAGQPDQLPAFRQMANSVTITR